MTVPEVLSDCMCCFILFKSGKRLIDNFRDSCLCSDTSPRLGWMRDVDWPAGDLRIVMRCGTLSHRLSHFAKQQGCIVVPLFLIHSIPKMHSTLRAHQMAVPAKVVAGRSRSTQASSRGVVAKASNCKVMICIGVLLYHCILVRVTFERISTI